MAYPTNYNTPEMLANSRRLYGGMSPGASRTGIDYQQPMGLRTPNPAYYQDVPGAPPPAPPPSYYMQRQGLGMPQSGYNGRAYAENPQLGGLAAGVNAIHDQNAAIAARGPMPTYIQQQMANFRPQSPGVGGGAISNRLSDHQILNAATGNQYAPMGAAGLVGNPGGRFFGGAEPGQVAYGGGTRQGFMGAGPSGEADMSRVGGIMGGMGYTQNDRGSWQRSGYMPGGLMGAVGVPATGPYTAGPGVPGGGGLMGGMTPAQIAYQQRNAPPTDMRAYRTGIVQQRNDARTAAAQAQMEQMYPQYGLAMAAQRQHGQYQQGLLGNQQAQIAANERIAGLNQEGLNTRSQAQTNAQLQIAENQRKSQEAQYAMETARSNNNLTAEREARTQLAQLQKEAAQINATAQTAVATANREPQMEQVKLQREQLAQQRQDQLRQQAREAYASGDIQGGQQIAGLAGPQQAAAMGQQGLHPSFYGRAGVAPPQSAQIPFAARQAVSQVVAAHQNNPDQLVQRLRAMGLSDNQINLELASAYGREGFLNQRYARTAQNPYGGHFQAVDPRTGQPHFTLPIVGGLIPGMAR